MRILKIKGKNEEVIYEQIKKEYGETALILSTQHEKDKGFFNWFRPTRTVVTVAVPEDELTIPKEEASLKVEKQPVSTESTVDSLDMLVALKKQMDEMQASLVKLYEGEKKEVVVPLPECSEVEKMKELLKEKLLEQGIHPEVIKNFLATSQQNDVEGLVREFYAQMEDLLSQSVNESDLPKIVFFVGAPGVGKTTTIAKLTADYVLNKQKKVVLFTSDTYRIAAIDQLKTYADILGVDIEIIYEEKELTQYINKWQEVDHIFIDTAGRSHKNIEQLKDMKFLIDSVAEKEVLLVMNASTAYKDIKNIIETYETLCGEFKLIITKLDETDQMGNILNIIYCSKKPVLYLTTGQNVPSDIATFEAEHYASDLLGRINYE